MVSNINLHPYTSETAVHFQGEFKEPQLGAGSLEDGAVAELGAGMDGLMDTMISAGLQSFLEGFKDRTSADILKLSKVHLEKVQADKDITSITKEHVDPVVTTLSKSSLSKLAEECDAKEVAETGEQEGGEGTGATPGDMLLSLFGRRRHLMGSGEMSTGEMLSQVESAVNITSSTLFELMPQLPAFVKSKLAKMEEDADGESSAELLILAAIDLSAVASRAAPISPGKDCKELFTELWSDLMELLPAVDTELLIKLIEGAP